MKMRYLFFIIGIFMSLFVNAQINMTNNDNTIGDETVVAPEEMERGFEDLMKSWIVSRLTKKSENEGYLAVEQTGDSVYMARLQALPCVMSLPYNAEVRQCIDQYVERRRTLVEYMLGMESLYFPMIEQTLDRYGLPLELKYLTIIESALNTTALSRQGASGLWQFMLPTAKLYGLEVNSLIDERRDPEKATDAACRFLLDLYNIYHDWTLAIAAYNCGGGNVNKAIARAGGKTNFWEIYRFLPRETRSYVPWFIAATYVMNYYAYHRLYPVKISMPEATDTISVNRQIHFDQIAGVLGIDKEELKAMNPQYKRDIVPGNYKQMSIVLPYNRIKDFIERENEIAEWNAATLFPQNSTTTASKTVKITHTVKKGETLVKIGNNYGVTLASIRKWNRLGKKVRSVPAGRKLTLYVDNGGL
jgi:membrane-bound lytic murein transglycosylase D